jgi:hypothetical protein
MQGSIGSGNPDSEDFGIPKGDFQRLAASTTMKTFDKWHMDIEALSGIDDKLVLLTRFSEIEVQIEPIERQIEELVANIDERVNLQVDEMRMQELLKEGRVIRAR